MSWITRFAYSISSVLVRNRTRLPRFINSFIDEVAKNPDGVAGRLASMLLGGGSTSQVPEPTVAPATRIRVFIGPTNYAGQGNLWARALAGSATDIDARNMAVELPGGFAFPADTSVPVAVYNRSSSWQRAELEEVGGYSHVLIEAERPLFGSMFNRDVAREVAELEARGLSVAFISHGTDIRSPRRHLRLTEWSYFADDPEQTAMLQSDADRNLALLEASDRPMFVSTPDLLNDLPGAIWCPVIVEGERWHGARPLLTTAIPVVAHIPSMGAAKGTHLIDAAMRGLGRAGVIEYRLVSGVSAVEMPEHIGDADIVLDQFRAGSYGVAACEAMAAGRVVVGHILPTVRDHILSHTGLELPIVEATPDTIAEVVAGIVADPAQALRRAAAGVRFVEAVHSGALSARALREHWIDLER